VRIANIAGRLAIVVGDVAVDVEKASDGEFGADRRRSMSAGRSSWTGPGRPICHRRPVQRGRARSAGAVPAPGARHRPELCRPRQRVGFSVPAGEPPVFTSSPRASPAPWRDRAAPRRSHGLGGRAGRHHRRYAYRVDVGDALSYVAGYAVGQDLSERTLQMAATPPQFSLGKSLPASGDRPLAGDPERVRRPNDLELGCAIDGEQVQLGRTRDLIFSVPALVAKLSQTLRCCPATSSSPAPVGCGSRMNPPRWLKAGEELVSHIEGIGELRHRFVDGRYDVALHRLPRSRWACPTSTRRLTTTPSSG